MSILYLSIFLMACLFEISERINTRNPLTKIGIGLIALGAFGHIIGINPSRNIFMELGVLFYLFIIVATNIRRTHKRRLTD
jgi:hypothetical protein